MTELEQLETDTHFASLKRLLDRAGNLDNLERYFGRKRGLTIKQARLFSQYYERKEEKRKKLETRLKEAPLTASEIRYRKGHPSHKVTKLKNGIIAIRNTKGRFVKIPRYFKQVTKRARSKH